jgi:isopenicillin-N epimerase
MSTPQPSSLPANAPRYGHALRPLWPLDPAITYLNHGGFGATPHVVLAEQNRWRLRLEAEPTRFMQRDLPGALRAAAASLAGFLGAEPEDLAFVQNATDGVNAVLRSLELAPGDELLTTTHVYPAVRNAMRFVAARTGARIVEAPLPYPLVDPDAATRAFANHVTGRTRLAVFDFVTSPTALLLPVVAMARAARRVGAKVLLDAAHAPGMIEFRLDGLEADWVTGNAHKWLFAPKGTAFLWADRAAQKGLHPTVISHGFEQGFRAEFDWVGTRDPSGWLAIEAALAFYRAEGDGAIRAHNRALADEAAALIAAALGSEEGQSAACRGALATVRLPNTQGGDRAAGLALNDRLWREHRIEVPIIAFADWLWVRVSAQIYNEIDDYRRLADALGAVGFRRADG